MALRGSEFGGRITAVARPLALGILGCAGRAGGCAGGVTSLANGEAVVLVNGGGNRPCALQRGSWSAAVSLLLAHDADDADDADADELLMSSKEST